MTDSHSLLFLFSNEPQAPAYITSYIACPPRSSALGMKFAKRKCVILGRKNSYHGRQRFFSELK